MSESFQAIAMQGSDVILHINYACMIGLALVVLAALRLRPVWLSYLALFVIPLIVYFVSSHLFHSWWHSVLAALVVEADRDWIARKDGGIIIPFFTTIFKCAGLFSVGLITLMISLRRSRKKSEIESTQSSPVSL